MLAAQHRLRRWPSTLLSKASEGQAQDVRQEQDRPQRISTQRRPHQRPVQGFTVPQLVQDGRDERTPRVRQLSPHKCPLLLIQPNLFKNHARERDVVGCQANIAFRLPARLVEDIHALAFVGINTGRKCYASQRLAPVAA